jgi:hypothetical protein
MKIHLSVTQDDINNGVKRQSDSCPIALALQRAVFEQMHWPENQIEVIVEGDCPKLNYWEKDAGKVIRYEASSDSRIRKFVYAFDSDANAYWMQEKEEVLDCIKRYDEIVKPFELDLEFNEEELEDYPDY